MLPTLRKERAATYSPVLPISEKNGMVLQVPVEVVDAEAGIVRFDDDGDNSRRNRFSAVKVEIAMESRLGNARWVALWGSITKWRART